jgi:hypothetical protein
MMSKKRRDLTEPATRSEVADFLRQVEALPVRRGRGRQGRLIFAMDATASREATWDHASQIQAAMFSETTDLGGLAVQLCFFRGFLEFEAYPWVLETGALLKRMTRVHCAAGLTQIARVLRHAADEAGRDRVDALVFVGDCMEEDPAELAALAGRLGLLGLPVFVFQEGRDPLAERTFREIARLSGGAYCPFDAASPKALRDLLSAVAVYAAGGREALLRFGRTRGSEVLLLTRQIVKG